MRLKRSGNIDDDKHVSSDLHLLGGCCFRSKDVLVVVFVMSDGKPFTAINEGNEKQGEDEMENDVDDDDDQHDCNCPEDEDDGRRGFGRCAVLQWLLLSLSLIRSSRFP